MKVATPLQRTTVTVKHGKVTVTYRVIGNVNPGDRSVGEGPFVEDLEFDIRGGMCGDIFWKGEGLKRMGFTGIEEAITKKVKEENLEQLVIDAYYQERAESRAGLRRLRMG